MRNFVLIAIVLMQQVTGCPYDQLELLKQIRVVLNESEKRLAENMKIADKSFSATTEAVVSVL